MKGRPPRLRLISLAFGASAVASLALVGVYWAGGHPQAEGSLLGITLGGMAIALVLWAKDLMPRGPYVEEREMTPSAAGARAHAADAFSAGADRIGRRGFLGKFLAGALGALGLAALFPIRSLGTRPGGSLFETEWTEGVRLVTQNGLPVHRDQLSIGGVLTVFPDGHTDAADSQTLLIRLEEGEYEPTAVPASWSPEGFVAFSKICTHAGCPVGLYQPETHELFCPCHQSAFAVLGGARPTSGPATRPLPQLPIAIDDEGFLVARSDFLEPVGPGFWNRGRD